MKVSCWFSLHFLYCRILSTQTIPSWLPTTGEERLEASALSNQYYGRVSWSFVWTFARTVSLSWEWRREAIFKSPSNWTTVLQIEELLKMAARCPNATQPNDDLAIRSFLSYRTHMTNGLPLSGRRNAREGERRNEIIMTITSLGPVVASLDIFRTPTPIWRTVSQTRDDSNAREENTLKATTMHHLAATSLSNPRLMWRTVSPEGWHSAREGDSESLFLWLPLSLSIYH